MNDYFPDIDVDALSLMIELQREDPTYVTRGGFPEDVEALFLALNTPVVLDQVAEVDLEGMNKWEKLEHESNELFTLLTEAGKSLDNRDSSEKMAYFRTATTLLERLVGIQERSLNLRRLAQFQQTVVSIMDDVLDGDQRVAVRERLQAELRSE